MTARVTQKQSASSALSKPIPARASKPGARTARGHEGSASRSARDEDGPGGRSLRSSAKGGLPSPSVTAFLLAPELKMSEWLNAAGVKREAQDTQDDALLRGSNALYPLIQRNPDWDRISHEFHREPAGLLRGPVERAHAAVELRQYLRLSAARDYLSLWVHSDSIFGRASGLSHESRREFERTASSRADGGRMQRELELYCDATDRLKKAFCAYFGERDFWKTRPLSERELFRLVNMHHLPQSREAALLAALRAVAEVDQGLTCRFEQQDLGWTLRSVEAVRQRLEVVDRLETIAKGKD